MDHAQTPPPQPIHGSEELTFVYSPGDPPLVRWVHPDGTEGRVPLPKLKPLIPPINPTDVGWGIMRLLFEEPVALRFYLQFTWTVLDGMAWGEGWQLTTGEIVAWLHQWIIDVAWGRAHGSTGFYFTPRSGASDADPVGH